MNTPEPSPIPNDRRAIVDLVVEDLWVRKKFGTEKYGTPLQAGNGRDALVDAYQETLDLCVYLRQAVEEKKTGRPEIVCLCGSTRFWREFQEASLRETLAGRIVLSIGAARAADEDDKTFGGYIPAELYDGVKDALDELHKRKIDLADSILVLNVGGYIGESTRSEIDYARSHNKLVRFLGPDAPQP